MVNLFGDLESSMPPPRLVEHFPTLLKNLFETLVSTVVPVMFEDDNFRLSDGVIVTLKSNQSASQKKQAGCSAEWKDHLPTIHFQVLCLSCKSVQGGLPTGYKSEL